jgi:NAD(P)-dependent dehydrogenase (short-subunit alcohol dehydrogenase family)
MTMHAEQPASWWITGASSGIGRELALLLAEHGQRVWISARSPGALQAVARMHPDLLIPLPCDVTDDGAMATLFRDSPLAPAWLDGVILCAGTCEYVDLPELDLALFRRVFDVNYFGVVNACGAALPLLRAAHERQPQRKPQLFGVGSLASVVGFPRAEAYGASKAALAYFLEALRCDVQQDIDVTLISPGFVATPMTERNDFAMPFLWSAREAAEYIVARLGSRRRAIRFPWQLRTLLRLGALLPWWWYRSVVPRLARKRASTRPAGADR